jgi:16S rRNA (cytosine967-C5)-methyltransferase
MSESSREIILDVLLTMEREREYSSRLLKAVLDKYDYLEVREKAFIKRVTEGTVERQIELDYYLDHFSKVPVRKMKPLIRCLLRMSVYQLLYLDTVPDSAVCNEACKLAVKRKFQNLKGFVNGVLRNIARNRDVLPKPSKEKEPLAYLSVTYSMPEWIVSRWLSEYGTEITEKMLESLLQIHPVSLRFAGRLSEEEKKGCLEKIAAAGAKWERSPYLSGLYTLTGCAGVGSLPGFSEGAFTVQDASSCLAVEAAAVKESDLVLDVCAAPGGKSMFSAEKAGKVLARDVSEEKVSLILENAERMNLSNLQTQVQDATVPVPESRETADVLLLDVPCSGLGVMGKKRDIKYHVTEESMESLTELQKRIVQTCWEYVKPGGTLVYSTCTINTRENEEMVRFILRELPFEPLPLQEVLPARVLEEKEKLEADRERWGHPSSVSLERAAADCCIQLLPGYMDTDGFFIARFRRKSG